MIALRASALLASPLHALAWIELLPWLLVLERSRSWRRTLALSLVLSELFALVVFGWFASALQRYAEAPAWTSWLALGLYAPLLQPQVWLHALARHALRASGVARAWIVAGSATAWVGAEWALPKLFRDTLAHGLFPGSWMRQGADLAGVEALTVTIVLVNECLLAAVLALAAGRHGTSAASPARGVVIAGPALAQVARGRAAPARVRARTARVLAPLGIALALPLLLALYGAWRHGALAASRSARAHDAIGVALVQADLAHYARMANELGTAEAMRRILDLHFAISEAALARGGVELLIWPETVYPTTFGSPKSEAGAAFDRELAGFVAHAGVPLVFGSYDVEDGREYNAAVFLEPGPNGALSFDVYRKATLFPLTERVPAWLDRPWLRERWPWLGTWTPGARPAPMEIGLAAGRRLRLAPLVCYDAVEPALTREAVRAGADLIVTLSNDAWFAGTAGARLHLAVSAFRSVETRRPQLRATNTGISAVIDEAGDVVASLDVHARDALVARVVPRRDPPTLAMRAGDATGSICATIAAATLAGAALAARRRPRT